MFNYDISINEYAKSVGGSEALTENDQGNIENINYNVIDDIAEELKRMNIDSDDRYILIYKKLYSDTMELNHNQEANNMNVNGNYFILYIIYHIKY